MKIEVEINDEEIKQLIRELLTKKIYDYIDYKTPIQSLAEKVLTLETKKEIKKQLNDYLQQINILTIIKAEVKKYIEKKAEEVMQQVTKDHLFFYYSKV